MNVAVVGSSGYIAGYILKQLEGEPDVDKIMKIDQTESADEFLDLKNAADFDYEKLNGIDFVVFTAAISEPDKCATDFETCWEINVMGTEYFIRCAIDKGCHVLFFSSDAVFGDIPGEIYTENSETLAKTPYGRMKKAVEDSFSGEKNFKAIRLSYVVSRRDRFVRYCESCIEKNCEAEVFHPFYRNCIVVSDVVNVVLWFLKNWDGYSPAILNVAGEELVSRVRIADELNRHNGEKLKYKVIYPGDEFYRNRPKITQMKSLYISKYGILKSETFTEKIQRELEEQQ